MSELSDQADCPKAVRDFLSGSAELVNLVSSRIYPDHAPEDLNSDFILITESNFTPASGLAGEVGTATSVIQIDFWASGKNGRGRAKEGGALIRNRLSEYRGALNDTIFANGCHFIRGPQILASTPVDKSGVHRMRCSMDVEIIHTVNVPTFA